MAGAEPASGTDSGPVSARRGNRRTDNYAHGTA